MAVSTPTKRNKKPRSRTEPQSRSHIDVYLVIRTATVEPREITRILGITPTNTWRVGDLVHPPASRAFKDNGWELQAKNSRDVELTKYVENLMAKLNGKLDRFASLPAEAVMYVLCDICDHEFRRTDLSLSKKAIQGLANLGVDIEIDYYDLSGNDNE
jgi:Domain of unknown function (DUF4279)